MRWIYPHTSWARTGKILWRLVADTSLSLTVCSEPAEFAPIDETFNPAIHRINNAVKMRAAHPEKPVPKVPATLLRHAYPPEDLVEKVRAKADEVIRLAGVKKGM